MRTFSKNSGGKMFKRKLCFLIPVFLFSVLFGEELKLENNYDGCPDIATHFEYVQKTDNGSAVVLSDGSQWIIKDRDGKESFSHISSEWRIGDEIRIGRHTESNKPRRHLLRNVSNGEANLFTADIDGCVDASNIFCIEKIDANGYAIVMQDGREWAVGYWGSFSTCRWQKGDQVVINKSSYSNWEDYLLINVNKKNSAWASIITWE